jgi:hypothetical protein
MPQKQPQQQIGPFLQYLAEQLYPSVASLAKGEPARPIPNLPASPSKVQGTDDPRLGAGLIEAIDLASNLAPVKAMAAGGAIAARKALPKALASPEAARAVFAPVKGKDAAAAFHSAIAEAKAANPNGAAVALYSPEEYAGMKLYATPDRTAGFAIKPDGDIVSVFKHPQSPYKGVMDDLMPAAIKAGGKKLDAFDPWLPQQYGRHGFREVARLPFNREYAPEGWNYATSGEPDVVFMALDKSRPFKHGEAPKISDYDEGVRLQTEALAPRMPDAQANAVAATDAFRSAANPDAPMRQYAQQYPEVGPPVLTTDKTTGKQYLAKNPTPEAEAFMKVRAKINKDMQKGYTPYYDPAARTKVDVTNYPPNINSAVDAIPKRQDTIDKHLAVIGAEETRKRLRDAVKRGEEIGGDADHWYWMGQLEGDFIKELGEKEGREAFKQKFATSMAATTGGSDPGTNFLTGMYGNYLREHGLPYPTASHEFPYPIGGGKHGIKNIEQHKRVFDEGGFQALGADNAKRHDFAWDFMGGDAPVIDEQMTKGMTPTYGQVSNKGVAPHKGTYGLYSQVVRDEAANMGKAADDVQGLGWFGFKGAEGKPMISWVNDAIERTHRLTGVSRDDIVRLGIIRSKMPIYGLAGGLALPGLLDQGAGE